MKGQLCSFSSAHACLVPWLMMSAILGLIYLLQAFKCCSEPNVKFMCRWTHTIKRFHIENGFSLISKWVPEDITARDTESQPALTSGSHYRFIASPQELQHCSKKATVEIVRKRVTFRCYLGNFLVHLDISEREGKKQEYCQRKNLIQKPILTTCIYLSKIRGSNLCSKTLAWESDSIS